MKMRFCPLCATPLVVQELDGRPRQTCPACGFINYENPVVAAGCLIERDGQVLMVQRRYPPRVGEWTLPAGFVEWDESPEEAALRETEEETGLRVVLQGLFGVYSWHHAFGGGHNDNGVLIIYRATIVEGTLRAGDDAQAVAWFPANHLPEQIAFSSHQAALAQWLAHQK